MIVNGPRLLAFSALLSISSCLSDATEQQRLRAENERLRAENEALRAEIQSLKFAPPQQSRAEDTTRLAWPRGVKEAYIERCAASMVSQGLPTVNANPYCRCLADGLEAEFGISEYEAMMQAQPDPQGDQNDRRLYRVLTSCSSHLPINPN